MFRDPLTAHPLSAFGREVTDQVLAPVKLVIGGRYLHPEDGEIEILSGCYRDPVYGRVSNWWDWKVLSSGEKRGGYGANWPAAN